MQNRPAFEIPYSEISNTNLAGKNEVAVEFALPANGDTGTNGSLGGARGKGKKAGAGKDQLVEMRFYIPGVTTRKEALEGDDARSDAEDAEEEQNAANLFYDTLMEKAEIGEVAGDTFATFLDVLHLTPRFVFVTILMGYTDDVQRPFRYGYVRELLQVTRKDIRLQDPIRDSQEVYDPPKTRRATLYDLYWSRSTSPTRPDKISFLSYAV